MKEKETIKVYVDLKDGHVACICHRGRKGCDKQCAEDEVTRDRFKGWEATMRRSKFGN